MTYTCKYCGQIFKNHGAAKVHEKYCKLNPSRDVSLKTRNNENSEYICEYCGKKFKTNGGYITHLKSCKYNANREENEYICKYCGKKFHNLGGFKSHENICKLNPNKQIALSKRKKRKNTLSHNEWLEKLKQTNSELFKHIEILGTYINTHQKSILCKCNHCGEIYEENIKNLWYGTWKCKKHCSHKIRRQKVFDERIKNFINDVKQKNPKFLERFEILDAWDGQFRTKLKVKCKKCGYIDKFSYETIMGTNTYNCKGCTIVKNTNLPKLNLSKNELTNWLKNEIPKTYNKIEIIDENINITESNKCVTVKCKECGYIWNINIYTLCKKRNVMLMCPNCNKRHDSTEEYLEELICSHTFQTKTYICKYCGKELKNKNALVQHEIRCKQNPNKLKYDKIWKCPYCGKEYNNPQSYAGHIIMCKQRPDWEEYKERRYYGKV